MTNKISPQGVLNELRAVKDPMAQKDIVSLGIVRDVQVSDHSITVILQSSSPARDEIVSAVRQVVQVLGVPEVKVQLIPPSPQAQHGQPNLIPKVKNTVAVASGKGGVGKSTVAANLAVAMLGAGAKVGL
ncbi:MAG TPA: P-loop NTPase, partial [Terriglobia bacterium]|nr:P-loop NTPase [Terriglobia bacterium]